MEPWQVGDTNGNSEGSSRKEERSRSVHVPAFASVKAREAIKARPGSPLIHMKPTVKQPLTSHLCASLSASGMVHPNSLSPTFRALWSCAGLIPTAHTPQVQPHNSMAPSHQSEGRATISLCRKTIGLPQKGVAGIARGKRRPGGGWGNGSSNTILQ